MCLFSKISERERARVSERAKVPFCFNLIPHIQKSQSLFTAALVAESNTVQYSTVC